MAKLKALGTSISYLPAYNSVDQPIVVGSLTSIGEIAPDSEELDATTLDSDGGYREYLQGFKDSGELSLSGYLNKDAPGQAKMRELYASGAPGYFWVTYPDGTIVAFTAYVKSYTSGAADVDGLVGFGTSLRISGLVQVISLPNESAQNITAGDTAVIDATATVLTGTPTYQWYSNDTQDYTSPAIIGGATGATYTTPALVAGTYYYFCVVSVGNYKPVNSPIHTVTAA